MNKKRFSHLLNSILMTTAIAVSAIALAQESPEGEEKKKPDEDKVNPLENVDINIIKREDRVIETHSVNGVVYMVKVIPSSGPPYFLYDTDGDGSLETRTNRAFSETTVQQWRIFQW